MDAYSPIDALGTENRVPFRSRSSTIGVHQPLIRPSGKKPSPATVRDVQCETCPFPDIQDEF
jgi:hypothetical protein